MAYDSMVVDGGWLSWRSAYSWHSAKQEADREGRPAARRFVESCLLYLRAFDARGLHVAWDGAAGRRGRRAIWDGYKAGRGSEGAPEEVRASRDEAMDVLIQEALPAIGARMWSHEDWEADDGCATLAKRLSAGGRRVLVVSGDKDHLQLVRKGVHLLRPRPRSEELATPVYLGGWEEYTGMPPAPDALRAWVTYQAVRGDPGDGIPGVKGCGEKAGIEAVRAYPDLMDRLLYGRDLSALSPRVRNLLQTPEAWEQAWLSWRLAILRDDLDLRGGDAFKVTPRGAKHALHALGWAEMAAGEWGGLDRVSG